MFVRREVAGDAPVVDAIHAAAFGQRAEADLASALRSEGDTIAELCWVAELDGAVVASVICSRGHLEGSGRAAVGLGPIGVQPDLQTRGAGSALMHAVIGAADALGEPFIALLGAPGYYGRFGFVVSSTVGIEPPDPAWAAHFQVRPLSRFDPADRGTFRYAAPFDRL
jgi:putative acetyltransferase